MAAAAARKTAAADPRSGRLRTGAPIRHPAARYNQRICRDRLRVLQRSRAGAGERRLRPPRAHAAGGGSLAPVTETLGEFGRIRRYFAPLAGPGGLGLKDDAALIDCASGRSLVVTVDAMVEGVHYLPEDPPELVAKKLLRVNLSDLAAKGARPLHYLLTTALPASFGDDWVGRFAAGLAEDQLHFGVDLLGGDSVATHGPAVLSLTALGDVATGAEIRRDGARIGDLVWVSGTIGDAHLGLKVLRAGDDDLEGLGTPHQKALIARFQLP